MELILSTIDVKEQWNVATADIPGAFRQADIIGIVHVKLEVNSDELLAKIEPKAYDIFIHMKNGKKAVYGFTRPFIALSRKRYFFGKNLWKIA